jgi:hypothetical protein
MTQTGKTIEDFHRDCRQSQKVGRRDAAGMVAKQHSQS